ncbi:MAG: hypothetical protein ACR2PW_00300 [Gammaproteobacteria bacterium]
MIFKADFYKWCAGVAMAALLGVPSMVWAQDDDTKSGVRHRLHNGGSATIHEITYPSGRTYYNFQTYLTPENTSLELPEAIGRARSHPPKEGYFEVYVDKNSLPITRESCSSDQVIVAMPWGGDTPSAKSRNRQRRQLYNRISRLLKRGKGRIKVVLEAYPRLTTGLVAPVRSSSVRQLELTSCKLYFRTNRGEIVTQDGLLDD